MALRRLVTSAATIAMLGCSDGASTGASAPPFTGTLPNEAAGAQPIDTAGEQGQVPTGANPEPSSAGAGEAPAAGQVPSEGQNPDNIGFAGDEESGGSEASAEMGAGADPASGAEQPTAEAPPPAEVASEPPVAAPEPEPAPEPEEPPAIVRPALDCGAPPPQLQGGVQACQSEDQGSVSGQDWFVWYMDGAGGGCMTPYDNLSGAFSAQWNNPGDFLARIGFWFDETQTFAQLGEIGADLKFTRQGSGGSYSFIGIYGWTVNPTIEYYIVEDSFGNGPAQPFNTQLRGNFTIDGAQYNVYSGFRQNQQSIIGLTDFTQIFSVRQNPRQCGHVSISEHFRQWQNMGMNLGLAKEAKILVEAGGGNGNGSITFTHANVTVTPPN
jgi:hypothetical protein